MKNITLLAILTAAILVGCTEDDGDRAATPPTAEPVSEALEPAQETAPPEPVFRELDAIAFVDAPDGLRVRDAPGLSGRQIGGLGDLAQVRAIREEAEVVAIDGVEGRWTLVQTGDLQGWVFGGFLRPVLPVRFGSMEEAIYFFEDRFNFAELWNPMNIDEFIRTFGAIGNPRTVTHELLDIGGWAGAEYGTAIDQHTIVYGPYRLVVWAGFSLRTLEITLDESEFANMFPHRTLEEYLANGNFGNIGSEWDGRTLLSLPGWEWHLVFRDGLLYQIAFYGFMS